MKEKMKKQNGLAAVAIVLIVIAAVLVAGVAFLGVRTVVTGEHFLQPFAELGWIEIDEDDDKKADKKKDDKVDEEKSEKEDKDDDEKTEGQKSSLLLDESKKADCYTITIDLEELTEAILPYVNSGIEMYMSMAATDTQDDSVSELIDMIEDMTKDCELIFDIYANENDLKQVIATFEYETFVENVYETMKDTDDFEYDSYEECLEGFEDEVLSELTTESLQESLADSESELADYAKYCEIVAKNGKIQISVDLRKVDLESYIEEYADELEDFGIDTENVVKSAVEAWNEYIDDNGYDGLIEDLMSLVETYSN